MNNKYVCTSRSIRVHVSTCEYVCTRERRIRGAEYGRQDPARPRRNRGGASHVTSQKRALSIVTGQGPSAGCVTGSCHNPNRWTQPVQSRGVMHSTALLRTIFIQYTCWFFRRINKIIVNTYFKDRQGAFALSRAGLWLLVTLAIDCLRCHKAICSHCRMFFIFDNAYNGPFVLLVRHIGQLLLANFCPDTPR